MGALLLIFIISERYNWFSVIIPFYFGLMAVWGLWRHKESYTKPWYIVAFLIFSLFGTIFPYLILSLKIKPAAPTPHGRPSMFSGTARRQYDGAATIAVYSSAGTLAERYVHGPGMEAPGSQTAASCTPTRAEASSPTPTAPAHAPSCSPMTNTAIPAPPIPAAINRLHTDRSFKMGRKIGVRSVGTGERPMAEANESLALHVGHHQTDLAIKGRASRS